MRSRAFSRGGVLMRRSRPDVQLDGGWFARVSDSARGKLLMSLMIFGPVIFGLIWVARDMTLASESMHWPSTEGVVSASEIQVHTQSTHRGRGGVGTAAPRSERNTTYYNPVITYAYDVVGVRFESHNIYFGADDESTDREEAERSIAERPVGSEVDVFYDPDDPQTAALVVGIMNDSYLAIILLLGFAGLGVYFLFLRK